MPPDNLGRALALARADDPNLPQIGLVGDTYTVPLSGKDTEGRFCLIDMHIPGGGGPPQLDAAAQSALRSKAKELAPKYRTEFLESA